MASYLKRHESSVIMKYIHVNKRHKRNVKRLQNTYSVFRRMCKNYIGFGALLLLDPSNNLERCLATDCM